MLEAEVENENTITEEDHDKREDHQEEYKITPEMLKKMGEEGNKLLNMF